MSGNYQNLYPEPERSGGNLVLLYSKYPLLWAAIDCYGKMINQDLLMRSQCHFAVFVSHHQQILIFGHTQIYRGSHHTYLTKQIPYHYTMLPVQT